MARNFQKVLLTISEYKTKKSKKNDKKYDSKELNQLEEFINKLNFVPTHVLEDNKNYSFSINLNQYDFLNEIFWVFRCDLQNCINNNFTYKDYSAYILQKFRCLRNTILNLQILFEQIAWKTAQLDFHKLYKKELKKIKKEENSNLQEEIRTKDFLFNLLDKDFEKIKSYKKIPLKRLANHIKHNICPLTKFYSDEIKKITKNKKCDFAMLNKQYRNILKAIFTFLRKIIRFIKIRFLDKEYRKKFLKYIRIHEKLKSKKTKIKVKTEKKLIGKKYPQYKDNRIYLNHFTYMYPIPKELWDLKINSHQPVKDLLKSKRGKFKKETWEQTINNYKKILYSIEKSFISNERNQKN